MGLRGRRRGPRRHTLKADPTRQWRLLDLQAIDTRLDQLTHQRTRLPQLKELQALRGEEEQLDGDLVRAQTALSDVQREVAKAEADVQLVRDRAARDRARLDAGTGSAKDLQAIQHELDSLARRQAELEDMELEVMERAESAEQRLRELLSAREDLTSRLGEATAARDDALGRLDREAAEVAGPRDAVVDGVGEDLVALYEKIRASSGGTGAAALSQRRCGGCHMELNQVDMDRIKAAPADEVLRCEECRRILVRTAESGI